MSRLRFTQAVPPVNAAYGQYSLGAPSGIIPAALTANAEVFQFRWNPPVTADLAVIRKVEISAAVSTTYFAAGVPLEVALVKSTAWSVQGTGGTAIAPAALLKRRTNMASSRVASGDIRVATTAALGAGTKTLETVAQSRIQSGAPITASLSGQIFPAGTVLLRADIEQGEYPLVLASQEGFSITVPAVPGTGTWQLTVNVQWEETDKYPY